MNLTEVLRAFLHRQPGTDREGRLISDGASILADGILIAEWKGTWVVIVSYDCLWAARQARKLREMAEKELDDGQYECFVEGGD